MKTIQTDFDLFIYFIIFIKICFLISSIMHVYFTRIHPNTNLDPKAMYWKVRTEFVFISCMAILLIYIFNPWIKVKRIISRETALLFYLFGWVLLITADWGAFVKEAPWLKVIISGLK